MFDAYRRWRDDLELRRAKERIRELEHTIQVLNVAIANYQDAWKDGRPGTSTFRDNTLQESS